MKLPIWVYDYKLKKYVVFPFHLLTTFPNGKKGFIYDGLNAGQQQCLLRYGHLFTKVKIVDEKTNYLFNSTWFNRYKCVLNERREDPSMKKDKGPR